MFVDIKVRGYHLDIYQHVNNARYLEFLEEARWEFIDQTGFDKVASDLGFAFVIVNININYRDAALAGDLIRVSVNLSKFGNKSAQFEQKVTKIVNGVEETLIADAIITFCFLDKTTGKAMEIYGELKAMLERIQDAV